MARDYAVKDGYTWTDADGVRRTWADTKEADIMRAAVKLMQREEAARQRTQRANYDIRDVEKRTVHEIIDVENYMLHCARLSKYGPSFKRRRKTYA